jgi:hypothetical protein
MAAVCKSPDMHKPATGQALGSLKHSVAVLHCLHWQVSIEFNGMPNNKDYQNAQVCHVALLLQGLGQHEVDSI